jgi:hypothetical protein
MGHLHDEVAGEQCCIEDVEARDMRSRSNERPRRAEHLSPSPARATGIFRLRSNQRALGGLDLDGRGLGGLGTQRTRRRTPRRWTVVLASLASALTRAVALGDQLAPSAAIMPPASRA